MNILPVAIAAMLPISELRGAIPIGLSLGFSPFFVILISIFFNTIIFFPVYFGLKVFYDRFLYRFKIVRSMIERTHRKAYKYIEKYGVIGLALFVAIPLPFTGAWTGTVAAWFFGLDWRKSFIAIFLGILVAAFIVSVISLGVLAVA